MPMGTAIIDLLKRAMGSAHIRPRFILDESESVRRRRNPILVWYDSRDGPAS